MVHKKHGAKNHFVTVDCALLTGDEDAVAFVTSAGFRLASKRKLVVSEDGVVICVVVC